jgi:hypothetical protein
LLLLSASIEKSPLLWVAFAATNEKECYKGRSDDNSCNRCRTSRDYIEMLTRHLVD